MSTIEYPNEPPASLDLSTVVARIFPPFLALQALADSWPRFEWPDALIEQFQQIEPISRAPQAAEHIHRILNPGA